MTDRSHSSDRGALFGGIADTFDFLNRVGDVPQRGRDESRALARRSEKHLPYPAIGGY